MRIGGIGGKNWRSGPTITHFLFALGSVHSAHGTHKKGNQKCLIARPNPFRHDRYVLSAFQIEAMGCNGVMQWGQAPVIRY